MSDDVAVLLEEPDEATVVTIGEPGPKGDQGVPGIVAALAPIQYDAPTRTVSILLGNTPGTAAAGDDPRFADARTPIGAAGGDLAGFYPNPTVPGLLVKADKNYVDGNFVPLAQKGVADGVATLNALGLIPNAQLPPLAITDTFPVASQAEMLALLAEPGDVAIRTDLGRSFILRGNDPSVLANWNELLTPADSVTSVNGRVGVVAGLAEDNAVVHNTGDEPVAGVKTFAAAPVVPDGSFSIAKVLGLQASLESKASLAQANTFNAAQAILGSDPAAKQLIVRGAAVQSANLQEWQDSAGVALLTVSSGGSLTKGTGALLTANADTGAWLVRANNAANKGLVVRGSVSQTANMQEWQDSTGAVLSRIGGGGNLVVNQGNSAFGQSGGVSGSNTLAVVAFTSSHIALIARGAASQTGDLTQWQDSSGAVLSLVNAAGYVKSPQFMSTLTGKALIVTNYDTGGLGILTGADANKGLVIRRNSATQAANLQEWQSESGGAMSGVNSAGNIFSGGRVTAGQSSPNTAAILFVSTIGNGNIGAIVRASVTQTADLQEWQDSAGVVLATVSSSGSITTKGTLYGGYQGFLATAGAQVQPVSAATVGVLVRGLASQTGDLQQWQDSTGAVLTTIDFGGRMGVRAPTSIGGALNVSPTSTTQVAAVIRGLASQTGDLQQWQDSASVVKAKVSSSGDVMGGTLRTLNSQGMIQQENGGGILYFNKATAQAVTPAAGTGKLYFRDGTNAGTLRLCVLGPGGVETAIIDNIA